MTTLDSIKSVEKRRKVLVVIVHRAHTFVNSEARVMVKVSVGAI